MPPLMGRDPTEFFRWERDAVRLKSLRDLRFPSLRRLAMAILLFFGARSGRSVVSVP